MAISLRDRILKGVLVSGFENDADAESVIMGQSRPVEGSINQALIDYRTEFERERMADANCRENVLARNAATLAALVRLKYGNSDPDIYALVQATELLARD